MIDCTYRDCYSNLQFTCCLTVTLDVHLLSKVVVLLCFIILSHFNSCCSMLLSPVYAFRSLRSPSQRKSRSHWSRSVSRWPCTRDRKWPSIQSTSLKLVSLAEISSSLSTSVAVYLSTNRWLRGVGAITVLNIADCRIKTVASCAVAAVAKRQQIKISLLLYVRGCPG